MDNVFIGALWRSVKYECDYLHAFETGSVLPPALTDDLPNMTTIVLIHAVKGKPLARHIETSALQILGDIPQDLVTQMAA